ncbi:hypothetical protein ACFL0C_00530 [Patescibacteria group bacterium]
MWFWVVFWLDEEQNIQEFFSTTGFNSDREATTDYNLKTEYINEGLEDLGCVSVTDCQIVFKKNGVYKGIFH